MEQQYNGKTGMRWKLYILILVLAAVGALGLLPSVPAMFAGVQQSSGMPLPLFMVATFLQTFLLTAVLGFLGLLLSRKTGLGAPLLESLVYRNADTVPGAAATPSSASKSGLVGVLGSSAVIGLLAGAVVFGVGLVFLRGIEIELTEAASATGWWQGLLSSLYGGINEEIMMRLFLLNGLLWALTLFGRSAVLEEGIAVGDVGAFQCGCADARDSAPGISSPGRRLIHGNAKRPYIFFLSGRREQLRRSGWLCPALGLPSRFGFDILLQHFVVDIPELDGDFPEQPAVSGLLGIQYFLHLLLIDYADSEQKFTDFFWHVRHRTNSGSGVCLALYGEQGKNQCEARNLLVDKVDTEIAVPRCVPENGCF